jgi:hypothetical protein
MEFELKDNIQEVRWGGVDWFALVRGGDERHLLMYAIRDKRVHRMRGIS